MLFIGHSRFFSMMKSVFRFVVLGRDEPLLTLLHGWAFFTEFKTQKVLQIQGSALGETADFCIKVSGVMPVCFLKAAKKVDFELKPTS